MKESISKGLNTECPGRVVDILEASGAFDPGSSPGRGVFLFELIFPGTRTCRYSEILDFITVSAIYKRPSSRITKNLRIRKILVIHPG